MNNQTSTKQNKATTTQPNHNERTAKPAQNKTITTNEQPNATEEAGGKARCDEEDLVFIKINISKTYSDFFYSEKFYCKWFYIF